MPLKQDFSLIRTGFRPRVLLKNGAFNRGGAFVLALLIVSLTGCATTPQKQVRSDAAPGVLTADSAIRSAPADGSPQPVVISPNDTGSLEPPKPEIEVGTGKFFDKSFTQGRKGSATGGGKVTFNFENQPVQAAVKAILGDLLHENYAIAPNVGGNVTFSTANPINPDQAMSVLEMLLSWTGNTLIHQDGRYTVLQIKDAIPGKLTPLTTPPSQAQGYEVRIFPLSYISPSEMAKLLKPYAKPEAFINIDPGRSLLIMAGTAAELQNYQRTIDTFDVDWLKGMSVGVYNLQHVEVATLMPELDKVFGTTGESPLAGMFRFIPLERVNAIIAITPQVQYLDKAREWIERLDRGGAENATQLYVYDVKNIRAADLGDYLSQIFLGTSGRGGSQRQKSGKVGQGLTPVTIGGLGSKGGVVENPAAPRPQSAAEKAAPISTGGSTDSDIRITSVEESNQLLVMATPVEWNNMQSAIRKLDIQPLQVQIEARILEVRLTGDLQYGVKWWFEGLKGVNRYENGYPYIRPHDRQRSLIGSEGPSSGAATIFWSYLNTDFEVAISALEASGLAKALAAPSLVVANNQEAQINVGTQIPVVQTFYNGLGGIGGGGGLGGTSGSVQYLNTGVVMSVTPRVNPGGLVYMDVQQEVSNPGPPAKGSNNPPINQRQLQTQVAVQSGETILLGGLIQENNTSGVSSVPGLSKIPILGNLFSSTEKKSDRTELIVLITPRVITNTEEAREITQQYMRQFQGIKPLHKGTTDPVTTENTLQ